MAGTRIKKCLECEAKGINSRLEWKSTLNRVRNYVCRTCLVRIDVSSKTKKVLKIYWVKL